MDFHRNGIRENKLEFWPVEHPMEPMEEDRPVKCPKIPDASAINDENSYEEESCEIWRRKAKFLAVMDKKVMLLDRKAPRMRKRPHNHSQAGNDTATFQITMPPLYPFPPQTTIISLGNLIHEILKS